MTASQARGAVGASSLQELADRLHPPRAVWVMLPAGQPTEDTIDGLIRFLSPGDTVLDGGNANYRDSMRRADKLAGYGLDFMDAGVSGGVWGLTHGYALMIGGKPQVFQRLQPVFRTLAPGEDRGLSHVGPVAQATSSKWCTTAL